MILPPRPRRRRPSIAPLPLLLLLLLLLLLVIEHGVAWIVGPGPASTWATRREATSISSSISSNIIISSSSSSSSSGGGGGGGGRPWQPQTRLYAKPPRRWGGVRRQIEGGDEEEQEGSSSGSSSSTSSKAPTPASKPMGNEGEGEEEEDPLAISDAQILEAMGRKRVGSAKAPGSGAGAAAGAGGEPAKWSMEWLESLSEADMLALDKRRLMEFLLRDIESDREWAGVPDEAVFAPNEEVDPKETFYDEKLTEEVFGKMPPLDDDDDDDDDDLELEDIFGEYDDEGEAEDDEELLRFLQGSETPEEVQRKLAALGVKPGEDPLDPLLNDDEVRNDEEDEDVYDMGAHLQPDEAMAIDALERGGVLEGDGVKRLLAGLGTGKLAAEGTDAARLMGAVRACLEQGDMAAASELLQRMEELGVEVGDLEEHAEALEGYRPAVPGPEKRRAMGLGGSAGRSGGSGGDRSTAAAMPMPNKQQQEAATVPLSGGVLSEEAVEAMKAQGACVGIDLGTTNSAVAVVKDGQAVLLPTSSTGDTILPSVVRFLPAAEGGGAVVVVGKAALDAALEDADNTFSSVKRLIGRGLEELVKEKELLSTVNLVSVPADPNDDEGDGDGVGDAERVAMYCPALQREVTPEEVSAAVLKALIADAAAYLGQPVNRAVITVPAYFTPEQCAATERAGRLAGLQRIKLLREPEAAALAYGLDKAEEPELIMVFDLGGGTFDVSVLEVGDGVAEVLATFGDNHLGGNDWDQRVAEWLAGEYRKQHGAAPPSDRLTMRRLLEAAERAKVRLSGRGATTTEVEVVGLGGKGKDLKVRLSRQQMEAMCADLYDRLLGPMRQAALMGGATLGGEVSPERAGSELIGLGLDEDEDEEEGEDEEDASAMLRRLEGGDRKLAEALRQRTLQGRQASKARAQFTKQLSAVRKRNPGVKIREFPRGRPLTEVVMVGGATRMPSIQRLVEAVTGIKPRTTVNPDEAVALGAGIHAGVLDGTIEDMEMMTPMQSAILRGLMEYEARGGAGERRGPQLKTGKRAGLF
jgi:molecular chaperone DnaK (HSP70)